MTEMTGGQDGIVHPVSVFVGGAIGLIVAAGGAVDNFNSTMIAAGLLTTAMTGAYTAYATHHTKRVTIAIARGIDTLNEKTIGQLAADNETIRAEAIPHDERTATEQRHIDTAPPIEPPQGPAR